jgi:signal transduction histidine kinase/CheY-like chemotaxis protein
MPTPERGDPGRVLRGRDYVDVAAFVLLVTAAVTLGIGAFGASPGGLALHLLALAVVVVAGLHLGRRWLLLHQAAARDAAGDGRAATERRRLAVVLRHLDHAVLLLDEQDVVVTVNEVAARLLGRPPDAVVGRRASDVLDGLGPALRQQRLPLDDGAGTALGTLVIVCRTDAAVSEERLLEDDRHEALARLAGGIAHDFNNILAALLNSVTLAKMAALPADPLLRRLDDMERAILRAQVLTQRLAAFFRPGEAATRPVRLGELVQQSAAFALAGTPVRCDVSIAEDLWPVAADAGQLGHAVTSLLLNAAEAMPSGGTIELKADNAVPSRALHLPGERYVRLTITDHGTGIPAEHLGRIFDPYFTTKRRGGGLGLAAVHAIVRRHHGFVDVDSRVGVGTTFQLYLPASEEAAEPGEDAVAAPAAPAGGAPRWKVLVMDDDEFMRETGAELLRLAGHDVEVAADGRQAIERWVRARDAGAPFDVVILDLTVAGGMGGEETMRRLRALDPDVRAIVSSGHEQDEVLDDFRRHGFRAVLPKPYRLAHVREALARAIVDAG